MSSAANGKWTITDAERKDRHDAGVKVADEMNNLLSRFPIRGLLMSNRVQFHFNYEVKSGALGQAYKEGSEHFWAHGAMEQLADILDSDDRPIFRVGNVGEVSLDVELTGGIDKLKRTKLVRVCPYVNGYGGFDLVLNNAFDDVW